MALSLNTVIWGADSPAVLLLHGLGDGAFVWSHVAPALAVHATVAAVELRGHGDSPHDPYARYEPETYAEDVLEVLNFHGWNRPLIVVGHSLGATVAIHLAAIARERVRGLALVDGGPGLDPDALLHIRQQFLAQSWFHPDVESFAIHLQLRHPLADPQLLHGIAPQALRPLPSGGCELKCDRQLVRTERSLEDPLLWEKLSSFNVPVRVIRGAASAVLTRRGAARMVDELPQCRLHTVPLAGHAVMLDNPGPLAQALAGFVFEVPKRRVV
jgi:3-oxoadipate enol-lactonase